MDVAEQLKANEEIILITLDPVSDYDCHNYRKSRPVSIKYWINSYVNKGVFDVIAPLPVAGQLIAGVGTFLTTLDGSNTVASAGGKWGEEDAADVNIAFPLYGTVSHGNSVGLYI